MKSRQSPRIDPADIADWFAGRLPTDWFTGEAGVTVDREEITIIGALPADGDDETPARATGRAARFRDDTRSERIRIAEEAQHKFGRTVSWGVDVGDPAAPERVLFTHIAVPVMTRLRQPERRVLDTLVDAGVARSRADALAWSVRLVGENTEEWLAKLRAAMEQVDDVRAQGPDPKN